jgi:hypothetical protein
MASQYPPGSPIDWHHFMQYKGSCPTHCPNGLAPSDGAPIADPMMAINKNIAKICFIFP